MPPFPNDRVVLHIAEASEELGILPDSLFVVLVKVLHCVPVLVTQANDFPKFQLGIEFQNERREYLDILYLANTLQKLAGSAR